MLVDRFAPSPTGPLHLGHAYSAWTGWAAARAAGGRFLLRMEDLDRARVRAAHYTGIEQDLAWLGLDWDGPVLWQSRRGAAYDTALARLQARGLVYRCTCTRRDISGVVNAPHGPDGPVYPGTCRDATRPESETHALRLDIAAAVTALGGAAAVDGLGFVELAEGLSGETGSQTLCSEALIAQTGDIVLRRRDGAVAYHLAVVVDDAHQGVTRVTRGRDLFPATQVQRLLQALLDLPTPAYLHHCLVVDDTGKRLAKRDDARAIAKYRADGFTAADVLRLAGI